MFPPLLMHIKEVHEAKLKEPMNGLSYTENWDAVLEKLYSLFNS